MNRTNLSLLAAFTLPLLAPIAAQAANGDTKMFTLDAVVFKGNALISTDTLTAVSGLTPGEKVDSDTIVAAFNAVVAEYQKDGVNGNIQPTMAAQGSHMTVTFNITNEAKVQNTVVAPTLAHETFTGNVKVSTAALQGVLTMKPGQDVTVAAISADGAAIGGLYKAAKVNVTIQPKVTNLAGGQVDVNYEITEAKSD